MVLASVSPGLLVGGALVVVMFVAIRWDARRNDVRRPLLWAAIAAVPCALGVYLYLFVPAAPLTGVLLTANTGLVLYGFEREIATEDDDTPPASIGDKRGGEDAMTTGDGSE